MLDRIKTLASAKKDFAFESTLASRTFLPFLRTCKQNGYEITLLYFWIESVELAQERVAQRVRKGGHNIPNEIVTRRYYRSVFNLINLYLPILDNLIIYNNSKDLELVAKGLLSDGIDIYDESIADQIIETAMKLESI